VRIGEAHVWRVRLSDDLVLPPPTPGEEARAARYKVDGPKRQYLRSHGALRAILGQLTTERLDFALAERGKPYLLAAPHLKFNLSHSHDMALIGAALKVEIGVDVERVRPLSDYRAMADRFFPPEDASEVADEADFFRRWTRIEASLKATGAGLFGMGAEMEGEWTVAEIDAGPEYSAAVALPCADMTIVVHDFGG
jgi:4'-phosphopantetheinyl transferase